MEILPFGDTALLVNFDQKIDREINDKVMTLAFQLKQESSVAFVTPAYCSVLVGFRAEMIDYDELKKLIIDKYQIETESTLKAECRRFNIPVCYDESRGIDLNTVSKITGLSRKEIIKVHTGAVL